MKKREIEMSGVDQASIESRATTNRRVNILQLLGENVPNDSTISGKDLDALIVECEKRGVKIPSLPITEPEIRGLQPLFAKLNLTPKYRHTEIRDMTEPELEYLNDCHREEILWDRSKELAKDPVPLSDLEIMKLRTKRLMDENN